MSSSRKTLAVTVDDPRKAIASPIDVLMVRPSIDTIPAGVKEAAPRPPLTSGSGPDREMTRGGQISTAHLVQDQESRTIFRVGLY